MASTLLGYEEALIRARSTRIWLSVGRTGDSGLLDRIFADEHPAIVFEVFKACVRSWDTFDKSRRELLISKLAQAASRETIAVALLPRLVAFDRVEYSGTNPPWQLFEALMPQVFGALPHGASFVDARFFSVMQSAQQFSSPETIVDICKFWLRWLEREILYRRPSDYELSVVDIVVPATRDLPALREGIIQQALSIRPTAPLIYLLRDVQDGKCA